MDPRVSLDGKVKRNLSFRCRESNLGHPGPSLVAIPTELKEFMRQQYRVVGRLIHRLMVQRGE
jgi:hypothetical protein